MTRFLASVLVTLFLACLALGASAASPASASSQATSTPAPPRLSPRDVALASPVPIWQRAGILVEQGGRALYTYTPDVPGQSMCDANCEALWPPHFAEADAKPHGPFTIARSFDGRPMWAWEGKPLYRWISDRSRGAAGGDGVAGVWYLVRIPAAQSSQVVRYFPMPIARAGASSSSASTSDLSRKRR